MGELTSIEFIKDLCKLEVNGKLFEDYCVYEDIQFLEFSFANIYTKLNELIQNNRRNENCKLQRCSKLRPFLFQRFRFIRDKLRSKYKLYDVNDLSKSLISKSKTKNKILLTTYSITWGTNIKGEKVDLYLESIMPVLNKKNYNLSFIDIDICRRFDKKKLQEKIKQIDNLYPFESFMERKSYKWASGVSKELLNNWKAIKENKAFESLAEKYGLRVEDVKNILEVIFRKRVHEAALYIETWKNILSKERPDLLVLVHDREGYGIAAKIVANTMGIPSIAIQSGLLFSKHWGTYSLLKDYKEYISTKPTSTCLYGEFSRDLLLRDGLFDESELEVTGMVRTDPIVEQINEFNKEEICKEYGLDHDKKIFVYCTQPKAGTEGTTNALFNIWKDFKDVQLIVKLHPRQNPSFFEECAKKYNISPIITKDFNLFKTLFVCDAMMTTVWSTTALEAMIFNKPVISSNFTGDPPLLPFVDRKAALGATNEAEMKLAISKLLFDEKSKAEVVKHGKVFLDDFFYEVDGKVHERIVKVIEDVLEIQS